MGIVNFLIILVTFFILNVTHGRPVSYPGGHTVMSKSNASYDSLYYHYSPTYKYSVGIESVIDKRINKKYAYVRSTILINRMNTKLSQRNFYAQGGISSNGFGHYFYGVHGDWETRRLFSGFGIKKTVVHDFQNDFERFVLLGLAPYLGEYGDLHSWLMVKSMRNSAMDNWESYPWLRFFKGNILVEGGYGQDTKWDVHLMYRF